MRPSFAFRFAVVVGFLSASASWAADEPIPLQEKFTPGYTYHVRTHVDLTGTLNVPAEKDKAAPKPLEIRGDSVIDYDERVLDLTRDGEVDKTMRVFRQVQLQRTVGDRKQEATIRDGVKRMVLLRKENTKVPFSPDGALTWYEIDLVRTDVFTPSLHGLLPGQAVRPGDKWQASRAAILALTDMERIDESALECKFDQVTTLAKRRIARVEFSGTVRGINEDGPSKQRLDGYLYFDLESNHLSYLSLHGVHQLLDKDGKEIGRVEGRFVLSRQANAHCKELTDEGMKGVALEPTDDNTRLLYDNRDLGVRFLYARRWRASERGNQVTLDGPEGNGILLSVEPLPRVPTGGQFLLEARGDLEKLKAKVVHMTTPKAIQDKPGLEEFNMDVEVNGQKIVMEYYVTKQADGGVTVAARLASGDGLAMLQKDVERIARSLEITKK